MSTLNISVSAREEVGRGPNRRLRAAGSIPGVIYGKSGSRSVSIDSKAFEKLEKDLGDVVPLIQVKEGDNEFRAIIQDVQRDSLKDRVLHVDLHELTKGDSITTNIVIHTKGQPIGVKEEGGTLEINLHEVEVKARPSHLPEFIEIDVSELHTGDSLKIEDLPKFEGVEYTSPEDSVVITVAVPTKIEEPTEVEVEDDEAEAVDSDSDEDEEGDDKETESKD